MDDLISKLMSNNRGIEEIIDLSALYRLKEIRDELVRQEERDSYLS